MISDVVNPSTVTACLSMSIIRPSRLTRISNSKFTSFVPTGRSTMDSEVGSFPIITRQDWFSASPEKPDSEDEGSGLAGLMSGNLVWSVSHLRRYTTALNWRYCGKYPVSPE